MKGKKHITNSKPLSCLLQTKPVPFVQAVETGKDNLPPGSSGQLSPASTNQKQMALRFSSTDSMDKRKAEMWALKCVVCDWSINSAEKMSGLFKIMFSDSQIASGFQMSPTKPCLINFGLVSHFRQPLVDEINCCSFFTMSFDESLGRVAGTGQVGLVVGFWNAAGSQVSVRYWGSGLWGVRGRAMLWPGSAGLWVH